MAVNIQDLLESGNLSDDAKQAITEAWQARLDEAREQITSELREEFAQRYEHDKGVIVEAVDSFVTGKLHEEMAELAEDKKNLVSERVKLKKAVSEHTRLLDKFVKQALAKEVRELVEDRNNVKSHVEKLNQFVTHQLAEELKDFHADKVSLVEQKVKMAREGKRQLEESKRQFVKRAAQKIEETVNTVISKEIAQYHKDITAARENDFGRRIFETFVQEFRHSHFNDSKEMQQLSKQIAELKLNLRETAGELEKQTQARQLAESKMRALSDRVNRKQILENLTAPLSKGKKQVMVDLLENVKTDQLEKQFKKYLPSVLDGNSNAARKPLTESVISERTGDKIVPASAKTAEEEQDVVDLNELRKLAGLSN